MSKRGSPHLCRATWLAANVAAFHDPVLLQIEIILAIILSDANELIAYAGLDSPPHQSGALLVKRSISKWSSPSI